MSNRDRLKMQRTGLGRNKIYYFALWGKDHAHTLDAYPDEIVPYTAEWRRERQLFAGPFDDEKVALKMALERCYELRNDGKYRKRKRPQPLVAGQESYLSELDDLVTKVLKSR
jgi:hypothetical protein